MQQRFFELAQHAFTRLRGDELLLCSFAGEASDFVRFNRSAVGQAMHVQQASLRLELVCGRRHAAATLGLGGEATAERQRVHAELAALRELLRELPEDPHLSYAAEVAHSEELHRGALPTPEQALEQLLAAGRGQDLVGLYAAGPIHAGFASSRGHRHWFTRHSYNLDWSFHAGELASERRAVKCRCAGSRWDPRELAARAAAATEQLRVLARPARTLAPGAYRALLAPAAVAELLTLLGWGGFGIKSQRSKRSPLLRLVEGTARLAPTVSLRENHREGLGPRFDSLGFVKPDEVPLIVAGRHAGSLVSARSAVEFGATATGAGADESPCALELAPGALAPAEALAQLGEGAWIGNLWYLGYSDRSACRITGMTRFATFWIEGGVPVAPLAPMRFDESLYRLLGSALQALTAERELTVDAETYGGRGTSSVRAPGALVDGLTLTL